MLSAVHTLVLQRRILEPRRSSHTACSAGAHGSVSVSDVRHRLNVCIDQAIHQRDPTTPQIRYGLVRRCLDLGTVDAHIDHRDTIFELGDGRSRDAIDHSLLSIVALERLLELLRFLHQ